MFLRQTHLGHHCQQSPPGLDLELLLQVGQFGGEEGEQLVQGVFFSEDGGEVVEDGFLLEVLSLGEDEETPLHGGEGLVDEELFYFVLGLGA